MPEHDGSQENPRTVGAGASALLLDTDLFFAVKVTETLKHVGYTTRTLRKLDAFVAALHDDGPPAVALVNLAARGVDWRPAIAAAREAGVPSIAFGPHVNLDDQAAARAAGATSVIGNSKLAADLPSVVARAVRRGASTDATHAAAEADTAAD
jgi:hypothetical protein